ncbi:TetR/AcrR family transcriptional regulator [Rugamonas sp.]|uniref:TetR/AcrR family transcriptional regulator n=1 Tax=Rugamonas sp. TaxID=1926287 RepID=UPI0025EE6F22|nr:TetR/AcrR family transcriptional regulator [Rugamonas sp.]
MSRTIAERADVLPLLAEVFRAHGYEGASLARICVGTGLGKGSIYHFFPGGKEEMAAAVLDEISLWFHEQVYAPLRDGEGDDVQHGLDQMFRVVGRYFQSGRKICLLGVFALGGERDRFAVAIKHYFVEWMKALAAALERGGRDAATAAALAQQVVGGIQGALVLSRACDKPALFTHSLQRLRDDLRDAAGA